MMEYNILKRGKETAVGDFAVHPDGPTSDTQSTVRNNRTKIYPPTTISNTGR